MVAPSCTAALRVSVNVAMGGAVPLTRLTCVTVALLPDMVNCPMSGKRLSKSWSNTNLTLSPST